ncbi:phage tail tape measure protein [Sutcliffiella horikoshii]|uniref:phage tail tape measure protein n=1 Tax=Sutcliffiella horikoshii TaxID=79883 RepID=UPI003CF54994
MSVIRELRAKFSAQAEGLKAVARSVKSDLQDIGKTTEKSVDKANSSVKDLKGELGTLEKALKDAGNPKGFRDLNKVLKKAQDELDSTGEIGQKRFLELNTAVMKAKQRLGELGPEGKVSLMQVEKEVNSLEIKLKGLGRDTGLDDLNKDVENLGDNISGLNGPDSSSSLGGLVLGIGKIRVATIGAIGAVVGLGAAILNAAKQGDEMKRATNGLQVETGATTEELESMRESLIKIYGNNYGESFQDIADTMSLAKQMTGETGEELEETTRLALLMRDSFKNMDVQESIRTASTMMKTFKITSDEAYTLMAQGAQKGVNMNGDMLDVLNEYSPQFKALGYDAEGFMDVLISGAEKGAFSMDKLADGAKESFLRIGDGSEGSRKALKELGLDFNQIENDINSGGKASQKAFMAVTSAIASIEDPAEKSRATIALMGTPLEDLGPEFQNFFSNVTEQANISADTLKKIDDIKYDSIGEAIQGIWRKFQEKLLIPLQDKMMPGINNFVNKFKNGMTGLIVFLNTLFSSNDKGLPNLLERLGLSSSQVQAIINAINLIQKYLSLAGQQIASFFQEKGAEIMAFWNQYGPQIMQAVQNVANGILAVIQFVMPLILFIIKSVWTNIKGVISGALNIIMGLIKIFTGLFTADWSLMWEGVKQLFSGAVQFIWNLLNLMFLGKILSLFKSFVTGGLSLLRGLWRDIVFDVKKFVQGLLANFKSFRNSAIGTFNDFRNAGLGIFKSFRGTIELIVAGLRNAVLRIFTSLYTKGNSIFSNILSSGRIAFEKLKAAITNPINAAKDTVLKIIDVIKGAFSRMKITIPKPKMPKVSVSMKKGIAGIPYPDFDVQWLASGGVVPPNSPRLVGMGDAKVPEAAVPLSDKVLGTIGKMIAATMDVGSKSVEYLSPEYVVVNLNIDKYPFAKVMAEPIQQEQEKLKRGSRVARGKNPNV